MAEFVDQRHISFDIAGVYCVFILWRVDAGVGHIGFILGRFEGFIDF